VVGLKANINAFGKDFIHIERSRESFEELIYFAKIYKTFGLMVYQGMNE